MSSSLVVFDLDGVIVDGMPEYWSSARAACIALTKAKYGSNSLPLIPPKPFVQLRPWVQHGWEMVLLAAELLREDSYLLTCGTHAFASSYFEQRKEALNVWGWNPMQLQFELEEARRLAIRINKNHWFSLHSPYPWVLQRFERFASEGVDWAVLTTKGKDFAVELLNYFQLCPAFVCGHESGGKTDVLKEIISTSSIKGFVEDRRETLEGVLAIEQLSSLPCYLASWGYLKPQQDEVALPKGIHLLSPETMASPLATWP